MLPRRGSRTRTRSSVMDRVNANRTLMWLALLEGATITYMDLQAPAIAGIYWSAQLRGEREVECTFKPQALLPKLTSGASNVQHPINA